MLHNEKPISRKSTYGATAKINSSYTRAFGEGKKIIEVLNQIRRHPKIFENSKLLDAFDFFENVVGEFENQKLVVFFESFDFRKLIFANIEFLQELQR